MSRSSKSFDVFVHSRLTCGPGPGECRFPRQSELNCAEGRVTRIGEARPSAQRNPAIGDLTRYYNQSRAFRSQMQAPGTSLRIFSSQGTRWVRSSWRNHRAKRDNVILTRGYEGCPGIYVKLMLSGETVHGRSFHNSEYW